MVKSLKHVRLHLLVSEKKVQVCDVKKVRRGEKRRRAANWARARANRIQLNPDRAISPRNVASDSDVAYNPLKIIADFVQFRLHFLEKNPMRNVSSVVDHFSVVKT